MPKLTFRDKAKRIDEILKHRPMDGSWHQVVSLLADILHWCDVEALHCVEPGDSNVPDIFKRLLKEARQERSRHHCKHCQVMLDDLLLATVCESHSYLEKE